MSEQIINGDSLTDITSKLIWVAKASQMSGLTPSYIRCLLHQDVIAGQKIGRDWFTTKEAIREYLKQVRRLPCKRVVESELDNSSNKRMVFSICSIEM